MGGKSLNAIGIVASLVFLSGCGGAADEASGACGQLETFFGTEDPSALQVSGSDGDCVDFRGRVVTADNETRFESEVCNACPHPVALDFHVLSASGSDRTLRRPSTSEVPMPILVVSDDEGMGHVASCPVVETQEVKSDVVWRAIVPADTALYQTRTPLWRRLHESDIIPDFDAQDGIARLDVWWPSPSRPRHSREVDESLPIPLACRAPDRDELEARIGSTGIHSTNDFSPALDVDEVY